MAIIKNEPNLKPLERNMSELALQLIEKEKRERTGKLDLGNCGLTDFPKELFELDWLEELSFNDERKEFENDEWIDCQNKGGSNIFIIEVLPREFKSFLRLKKLYLSGGSSGPWSLRNFNALKDLTNLQLLDLSQNKIRDISFLLKLNGLLDLNLSFNNIRDVSPLENLHQLRKLNLSLNRIDDFSYISQLTNLKDLILFDANVTDLGFLKNLLGLVKLELAYNDISDHSLLVNLIELEELRLSNNSIRDIEILRNLTKLKILNLGTNRIKDISCLQNLVGIQILNLELNEIVEINVLENLRELVVLDIGFNQIIKINSLGALSKLKRLDIDYNLIKDLEPILPLLRLELSISIDYFDSGITVSDNPIINPPIHIVEQGRDSILDWFEQIKEYGAEPFYESKLMILGQGESGKTTFANLQLDPNYEVRPGKIDSTLGIVVHRGKEFAHNQVESIPIKAHLWDFGGQDIQKMLHQFFITENCLYVLVSNKRAENAGFDYWFQIINLLGPRSSVIVLENPKGSKGSNENFALNKYRELYPDLVIETIEVNLSETRGRHQKKWGVLNETIAEKLSEMEIVNRLVPKKWGLVRDELEKLKGRKYISKDSFYELCANAEIGLNHRQADWCLAYFRSLGDLVYFDDRDLCTHIFLDHNWLTQGMYYILSDKKIESSGGRFTRAQAYQKWETNKYKEEEKAMLLRLLLKDKFDICYELTDERDVFITPLLLPADKPAKKWDYETNLQFRYQYGFIPHGLFSRLIVKLHEKIDSEQHWKTGVRLKDTVDRKDVRAEVQQYNDPEENQQVIDIKISGDKNGCKQMLAFIRSAVDKLHKDFRNISAKEIVACNCETCIERMKNGGKPSFYEFEKLQKKILNRSYYEECEKSNYKLVNIGLILNDIIVENAANENRDSQLLKQLKEMGMSINQIINNNQNNSSATSASNSSSSADATATNTITISIQTILGEVQSLKEDFEDERKLLQKNMNDDKIDVTIRDIEKAETAIKEIEAAQSQGGQPAPKSTNRLKRFIDDLSDEESTLHKGLKLLRKGKDYGVTLAETYNKIAPNIGLVSIPPLALDVIKKL